MTAESIGTQGHPPVSLSDRPRQLLKWRNKVASKSRLVVPGAPGRLQPLEQPLKARPLYGAISEEVIKTLGNQKSGWEGSSGPGHNPGLMTGGALHGEPLLHLGGSAFKLSIIDLGVIAHAHNPSTLRHSGSRIVSSLRSAWLTETETRL